MFSKTTQDFPFFQICEMLKEPVAQQGTVPGSGDAPYVQSGDQWIGFDSPSYIEKKVMYKKANTFFLLYH